MAGRLKLSATGIQDYWLTEEPDFSYFLMNFKRHTKFSTEAVKTPFDGDCNFDTINECRIPNNKGDLMRSAMLQFTLPQPKTCLLYTSPSPRDQRGSRMPSSA